jgi:hypothetical protein
MQGGIRDGRSVYKVALDSVIRVVEDAIGCTGCILCGARIGFVVLI